MNAEPAKQSEGTREAKRLIMAEKRFLCHRFETGGTILHIAAQYACFETLRTIVKMWKSAQKHQATPRKLREALVEPDYLGWTPLVSTILLCNETTLNSSCIYETTTKGSIAVVS